MSDPDWWRPESISQSEHVARKIMEIDDLDTRTDFGSYRRLNLGGSFADAQIDLHNDLNPLIKVKSICRILKLTRVNSIIDIGCGIGNTTEILTQLFPNARVVGLDVSVDAIAYAQRTHNKAIFQVALIDPNLELVGKFDLVFCIEFYPFTRTRDAQFQANLIRHLSLNLEVFGSIIISQTWNNEDSLPVVLDQVKQLCPELKFQVRRVPHTRLASKLPHAFALVLGGVIGFILDKELIKKVIIVQRVKSN